MNGEDIKVIVADILEGAATYIERYGWHRCIDDVRSPEPFSPACVLGAITIVVRREVDDACVGFLLVHWRVLAALAEYLRTEEGDDFYDRSFHYEGVLQNVSCWNNRATATQVVTALRGAATHYRARHITARKGVRP